MKNSWEKYGYFCIIGDWDNRWRYNPDFKSNLKHASKIKPSKTKQKNKQTNKQKTKQNKNKTKKHGH